MDEFDVTKEEYFFELIIFLLIAALLVIVKIFDVVKPWACTKDTNQLAKGVTQFPEHSFIT